MTISRPPVPRAYARGVDCLDWGADDEIGASAERESDEHPLRCP